MSNELLEKTFQNIIETGQNPNIQVICPDEEVLRQFVSSIIVSYDKYAEYLLDIDILNIQNEQNEINNILAFCNLKSLSMNDEKLKLLIIYQYNEILSENIINTLEECLKNRFVRLLLITTNIHVTPKLLKPKIASFNLKPNRRIKYNAKDQENDMFFNLVKTTNIDQKLLSSLIQEWCSLNTIQTSAAIYDEWNKIIMSYTIDQKV